MKTELHTLATCVSLLTVARPVYAATNMLIHIKQECEWLKTLFNTSFNYITDAFMLTETTTTRYTGLVALANDLWDSSARHNSIHRAALMELIALIAYMEQHYSDFLKTEQAISDFERFKLHHQVSARLITINHLLLSKGVSENLVCKIIKAVDDLFDTEKHLVFSRADHQYLKLFISALFTLAADQRNKDHNLRLRRLLIQWNFNHMGVYKALEAEQQKNASAFRCHKKQHQYLHDQGFWLNQIEPKTTSGYNMQTRDLKSLLLKQVESLQVHFAEVLQLKQFELLHKFGLILSVDEFAIEFKYNYDEGIFDYPHKKDAAEALCPLIRTKGTDDVSVRNLLKFDKTKLYRAAVKSFHRHCRIIEKLAKDFGIGLPE